MIKEEFKNKLQEVFKEDKNRPLNIDGLIRLMEESDIEYLMADLNGPMGMATFNAVYINFNVISKYVTINKSTEHLKMLYFIILHETAHFKRIRKMGKDVMLKNLSLSDFNEFSEHIINEEVFADKYASIIYYKLNKFIYPKDYTQRLDNQQNKERYKEKTRSYFNVIQNDETKYNNFVNKFINKIY